MEIILKITIFMEFHWNKINKFLWLLEGNANEKNKHMAIFPVEYHSKKWDGFSYNSPVNMHKMQRPYVPVSGATYHSKEEFFEIADLVSLLAKYTVIDKGWPTLVGHATGDFELISIGQDWLDVTLDHPMFGLKQDELRNVTLFGDQIDRAKVTSFICGHAWLCALNGEDIREFGAVFGQARSTNYNTPQQEGVGGMGWDLGFHTLVDIVDILIFMTNSWNYFKRDLPPVYWQYVNEILRFDTQGSCFSLISILSAIFRTIPRGLKMRSADLEAFLMTLSDEQASKFFSLWVLAGSVTRKKPTEILSLLPRCRPIIISERNPCEYFDNLLTNTLATSWAKIVEECVAILGRE